MRVRVSFAVIAVVLCLAHSAAAQDFGVLESAETINRGNAKLGVYPMDVDFVAEFGAGVTDRSSHYVGFGLALSIR